MRTIVRLFGAVCGLLLLNHSARAADPTIAWGTVPSPNTGVDTSNRLNAVSVLSGSDIWAVGSIGFSIDMKPVLQHFNGTSWSIVPLPAEVEGGELFGVAAVSANDVWIVGGYQEGGVSLILRWNGSNLSVVSHPLAGTFNRLYAVSAVSAADVWAVGEFSTGWVSKTLTQHWDGSSWQIVASPTDPSNYTRLSGVAAISGSDVWAVCAAGPKTFSIRWNGTQWQTKNTPSPGSSAELKAVAGSSSTNVWAVGDGSSGLLTEHWNGNSWGIVPSPDLPFGAKLNDVDAVSSSDVWAVGTTGDNSFIDFDTVIIHWNGSAWSLIPSPNGNPNSYNELHAVAALSATRSPAGSTGEPGTRFPALSPGLNSTKSATR